MSGVEPSRGAVGRIRELQRLREEVTPPPDLVARVMTRVSEPRMPTVWQWLQRPILVELRVSPLMLIGFALLLAGLFIYVGATLR